ncbi:MAG TPA: zinc-dependent alcohol dehydrogenase family protein [Gemmataceae bacterium]|nr:zinc-dependent alcohol dehydrogenase family protein [Gemmataceae bacterium]
MKALVYDKFGEPSQVLRLMDVPVPEPGPGQVRVRMLASPINPSDLLSIRGQYGKLAPLPATPGFEGVGVIDATGSGLLRIIRGLRPGRRVAVLNGGSGSGNWQEQVIIPARQAVPVSSDLPDEQVAMFFVNPATALIMTRGVLRVPAGEWLLQSAAASALGRMVIRLGKHFGFRTINVVRRADQAEQLRREGAEHVLVSAGEPIADKVQQLTGGGAKFALDAVGGPTAKALIDALGPGARMLVYGTLSGEPIPLDPRSLIAGQKSIAGFWLSEWAKEQGVLGMLKLFKQVQGLMREKILTSEVAGTFALEDYQKALTQAETPGRMGKVLLRIGK